MNKKIIIGVVAIAALTTAGVVGWQMTRQPRERALSGYIEGETLYLSAPVAGAVTQISVRKGQRVEAGAALFLIEPNQLAAQQARSAADVEAAQAQARDVRKGQRPLELGVFEAQVAAAQAVQRQAQADFNRVSVLVQKNVFAPARLDEARAALQSADAQVRAAQRTLDAARQGAREDQIAAADARVKGASASLAETSSRLSDLSPKAAGPARVEDVFLQRGEWATANQPVVALIPDERVFVRFFAAETEVAAYRVGTPITFTCDGCAKGLKATVSFVSPRPEFTPPVIYSRDARDRLVFMVEATPDNPRALVPGLPVDVTPLGAGK